MNFENIKILVVGDIILDKYSIGDVNRISPEAPIPVLNILEEKYKLGGAANVAANIKSLGGSVTLFGGIGKDAAGEIVGGLCSDVGVDLRFVEIPKTTVKNRFMAGQQQLLRADDECLTIKDQGVNLNFNDYDAILVSDYGKGMITDNLMKQIKSHRMVIVDPKPTNYLLYHDTYLIKPNEKEAINIALKFGKEGSIEEITKFLGHQYHARIAVTRGEKGMVIFDGDSIIHLKTASQEVYDVTGAGDSVAACIALCIASGFDFVRSCEVSNLVGKIAVKHIGVAAVTIDELNKEYDGIQNN